jgi:hypothetical protein
VARTRPVHGRPHQTQPPPSRAAAARNRVARWSTVGLYEIAGDRIAACWLLPLDQAEFDRVWSG